MVEQRGLGEKKARLDEVDRVAPLREVAHGEFGRLPSLGDQANAQQGLGALDGQQAGMQTGLSVTFGGLVEGGKGGRQVTAERFDDAAIVVDHRRPPRVAAAGVQHLCTT